MLILSFLDSPNPKTCKSAKNRESNFARLSKFFIHSMVGELKEYCEPDIKRNIVKELKVFQ